MNPNEIRIGNRLNFTFMGFTEQHTVYAISPKYIDVTDDMRYEISMASSITITEEWLLKFGFAEIIKGFKYVKSDIKIVDYPDGFAVYWSGIYIRNVNTLHDLQNLYFALTGEELTA